MSRMVIASVYKIVFYYNAGIKITFFVICGMENRGVNMIYLVPAFLHLTEEIGHFRLGVLDIFDLLALNNIGAVRLSSGKKYNVAMFFLLHYEFEDKENFLNY